ncbi:hypothetical protein, partial [Actinoplanes sp. G11-F43]|uniref:hypothetical protein n=1 Tax=Actinoplanes sp. G11-F43 TaxID=3424130 RepID=UPI003D3281F4
MSESVRTAPWQQPGHPNVRVAPTGGAVYPFELAVGDHTDTRVPMTKAALRNLRDALTAILAQPEPADPADFVTDWARVNHAVVRDPVV